MADIITYPLYYTPYYSPSSGIVNLDGFIFHTTTSGDNYYFPLFIQYPFNLTRLYYKSTADRTEPTDIDRPFLTGLLYLPIDVTETYTTSGVLTLGFNYSNNVCFIPCLNDIPLNIGTNILDICYDGCYILVCTNFGVECLNSRTFESIWYFNSEIIKTVCCKSDKVCFGTICSGVYYNDFPNKIGYLEGFLLKCNTVSGILSNNIEDIYATSSGFFIGGCSGVSSTVFDGSILTVDCQKTQQNINSVAYSKNTETFYWSNNSKVYASDVCMSGCFVVRSTAVPGYTINSINIENISGEDVLYVNTTGGIFKVFSPSCSGSITTKDIESSDYCSGTCSSGIIYAGSDEDLLKIDVVSEKFESYFADGKIVEVLYYKW